MIDWMGLNTAWHVVTTEPNRPKTVQWLKYSRTWFLVHLLILVNRSTGYSPPCSHSGPRLIEGLLPLTCVFPVALRVIHFSQQEKETHLKHVGILSAFEIAPASWSWSYWAPAILDGIDLWNKYDIAEMTVCDFQGWVLLLNHWGKLAAILWRHSGIPQMAQRHPTNRHVSEPAWKWILQPKASLQMTVAPLRLQPHKRCWTRPPY